MYRTILVPLDGFPIAEQSIPLAARLAAESGARLHLVHALDMLMRPQFIDRITAEEWWKGGAARGATEYLERHAQRLTAERGLHVTCAVVEQPVVSALLSEVARVGADLTVMTTHGRGPFGRMWMGSVADGFARQATCPVIYLRATQALREDRPFRKVLVPLDGSMISEEVVRPAAALAELEGAQVTLLHVAHPWNASVPVAPLAYLSAPPTTQLEPEEHFQAAQNYLHDIAATLPAGLPSQTAVIMTELSSAGELLRYADEHDVDLIAIGMHGKGGVRRLLMGSVSDKVLRGAHVPVLLYRPAVLRPARDNQEAL